MPYVMFLKDWKCLLVNEFCCVVSTYDFNFHTAFLYCTVYYLSLETLLLFKPPFLPAIETIYTLNLRQKQSVRTGSHLEIILQTRLGNSRACDAAV
jgi:hypothetical protein